MKFYKKDTLRYIKTVRIGSKRPFYLLVLTKIDPKFVTLSFAPSIGGNPLYRRTDTKNLSIFC